MSEDEKGIGESAGAASAMEASPAPEHGDEHTTAPNPPVPPATPTQWTMPKPVFKQTSGYLPQGYLKDIQEMARTHPDSENTTQEQGPAFGRGTSAGPDVSPVSLSASAGAAAVEPQPDLSEQLIPDDPVSESVPKEAPKSGTQVSMVLLGVIGFLAFIAIFLTVVYYLFIKGNGDTSPF